MIKHLAATLGMTLAGLVLVAACANSNGAQSASPTATQELVTPAAANAFEQIDDEGLFLRVIAPLDEARGYCLDIPGHLASVQLSRPLQAHTCKHGIWNQGGRFDQASFINGNGVLRMPHYELCLQAENSSIAARLVLADCAQAELKKWTLQDSGEIALKAFPQMCISVQDGPGRDAGGPQYLIKGVGLESCRPPNVNDGQW